jgi:hypothetical protein
MNQTRKGTARRAYDMTNNWPQVAVAVALTAALGACQSVVAPTPSHLQAWTAQLRDAQPEDAFAAVYRYGSQRLIFVGAKHANRTDSLTFRLIDEAYASFHVSTLIVEGPPYSRGANADRLITWVDSQREIDGFIEGGEIVPAVRQARARGADVWGGEPDDANIRDHVLAQGFAREDMLGFYTLRSVPQWIRERKIEGPSEDRVKPFIESELEHNRQRLALPPTILPDYMAWSQWYAKLNGKRFGKAFDPEATGPLADGNYESNKIAEAVSRARDEFLLDIIARHLNAHESTMVVFGESHLMILRPALDSMLGTPCYVGGDLKAARTSCSGSRQG